MKDFRQRKQNKKPIIYSKVFFVIIFLILIFFLKSVYSSHQKKINAYKEQEKLNSKYQELSRKVSSLKENIEKLKTEEGKKEELKKNNNVGNSGETILRIVESRN